MFVTKTALSRRTVLRGLGTALALPFLDAMTPAFARGQQRAVRRSASAPYRSQRRADRQLANDQLDAQGSGRTGDHADHSAAGAHRDYVTVIGNLSRAGGKGATDHAVSSAGWLSGVVAKQTEAQDISLGITIDQVLAKQIGQDSPFPSIEFATEDFSGYIGGYVPGYSCTYMNTISWAGETSPLPMESTARRLRADVRTRRRRRQPPAAHAGEPQHPRLHRRGSAPAAEARRRAGPRAAGRLPGRRARDRTPDSADRVAKRGKRVTAVAAPVGIRKRSTTMRR